MNTAIQQIQAIIGVKQDGAWGPKSQAALISAPIDQKTAVQDILGVKQDGLWGPASQAALNKLTTSAGEEWRSCKASSFADPADVRAFTKCKATGKTDVQCFAVGDNGIGQFGKVTAQEKTPMVAVHKNEMNARWGSVNAAAHRAVKVRVKGVEISATVEDRISAPGRIDLNPAAAKQLGLNPPFVVDCEWKWA